MSGKNILIIDDEEPIRELLKLTLETAGFETVFEAADGETGISLAKTHLPDLILLDLMLPGIDGLTVCRRLKEQVETQNIPIIMLTAKSEESDIVLGLEMGADDYITKPFSRKILIARVRALLRRTEQQEQSAEIRCAGLVINREQHLAKLNGETLDLTFSEFSVLAQLTAHPGRVFTRNQIISRIKGDDYPVTERAIDVQIVGLRKKQGDWGANIETVRGVGYRLSPEGAIQ